MGKKKKERAYQWMKKTRPARNLNSAPIQKHLVDLQTRVSSTLQSIQTAAFQLLLLSTILSSKDHLSPSNVEQCLFFFRVHFDPRCPKFPMNSPKSGERLVIRASRRRGSLQRIQERIAPDGASGFGRSLRNLK